MHNMRLILFIIICGYATVIRANPAVEWTYHKSADGSHPDGNEQMLVWLMNRARQNPKAEGEWLSTDPGSDVADWRRWYNIDAASLQKYFAGYSNKPPAAFDIRLYNAAHKHSANLIAKDGCALSHTGQFKAVGAAGFRWVKLCGSVVDPETALSGHAGWNIDGNASGGGHRNAVMSLGSCADTSSVGVAMVPHSGNLCTTGNYAKAKKNGVDHFNTFLVGTVWQDRNGNGRYDPGEGYGNIQVMPDKGTYFAITAAAGGYALPLVDPGKYNITFTGSGIQPSATQVTVGKQSLLLDYQIN
jgi:hypothetical protein